MAGLAKSPCLIAFLRLYALPLCVRGPVDFLAFSRLAFSLFSEGMASRSVTGRLSSSAGDRFSMVSGIASSIYFHFVQLPTMQGSGRAERKTASSTNRKPSPCS